MSISKEELLEVARLAQMDLTSAKAKMAELQRAIASLDLPEQKPAPRCRECGIEVRGKTLGEHLEDVHGIRVA